MKTFTEIVNAVALLNNRKMSTKVRIVPEEYFPSLWSFTLEKRCFFQLFVGILLCANNGACFCFALFSEQLKDSPFCFSQSQISVIGTIGVLTSFFSFPTGYIYDKWGPQYTIAVGTSLNAVGWLGLGMLFRLDESHSASIFLVILFYGASQLSASFFETSAMLTNLRVFSCYQGRVVQIQKTFMGLGTALAAQAYLVFFQNFNTISPFLFFLCVYSVLVGILSYSVICLPTERTRCLGLNVVSTHQFLEGTGEPTLFKKPFNVGSIIILSSVGIILAMTLIESYVHVEGALRLLFGALVIGVPMSFVSMVFITSSYSCNINGYREANNEISCENTVDNISNPEIVLESIIPAENPISLVPAEEVTEASNIWFFNFKMLVPEFPDSFKINRQSLRRNVLTLDIWLLWFVCFASWGAMTLISANCSQIYQAVSNGTFSPNLNAANVSVFGAAGSLGRIAVGVVHPFLKRNRIVISALCSVPPLLNVVGLPLFLIVPSSLIFIPFLITGVASGISWGSTILIVTTFYDSNNCAKHYSFLYTAGMVSPIIFNTLLFGPMYDYYGKVQANANSRCDGVICIWVPIIACFFVTAAAFPMSLLLIKRTVANNGV